MHSGRNATSFGPFPRRMPVRPSWRGVAGGCDDGSLSEDNRSAYSAGRLVWREGKLWGYEVGIVKIGRFSPKPDFYDTVAVDSKRRVA